ncbi:MAG TPA: 3-hydroxyacyl-CoA dehydrogenase PaaH [Skermanella sp.]|nr:3-hydroxyacyl-CoA dehydrogenase PaaH [Skermanella sp.]
MTGHPGDITPPLPSYAAVAVIGAGTMGSGIASVAAAAGHPVLLYDADPAALERGIALIAGNLDRLVERRKIDAAERDSRLKRIKAVSRPGDLAPAKLVIEAIVEDLDIKAALLGEVESAVGADAIVATNTSSLSVTALAARLRRPDRVVGMHFFNPAPVLPLVEVVSGHVTGRDVADTIFATAKAWGKIPVHCRSTPGFIVNRVARPYYGEALRLVAERAAAPAAIDAVLCEAGGFRMGPFDLMDLIGHDVNFAVTRSVYDALFQDPRYRPSLVQKDLVDAGLLGRKSGRGFYDYRDGAEKPAPALAPDGPRPEKVVFEGDLGVAGPLLDLARTAGLSVETRGGDGVIRIDGVRLALTDGRTATARAADGDGRTVLFDLALDYQAASRMCLAAADQAGPDAAAGAAGFFQALGKAVLVIDDAPGLIVMRTLAMLANEAADAVHHGIGTVEDVDLAMLKGVNYPRGPLAWAEAVGLPQIVAVLDNLADVYGEDRYRTSPLLRRRALAARPFHSITGSGT